MNVIIFCLCRRIRLKNSGSIEIEIESELDDLFVEEEQAAALQAATVSTPLPPTTAAGSSKSVKPHNPWALKCHQKQLSKLRRSATQKEKESHCQSMCFFVFVVVSVRSDKMSSCA